MGRTSPLLCLWAALAGAGCSREVDVHVVGWERNGEGWSIAKVWKNGKPRPLSDQPSVATAIAVSDGDVYVAGAVRFGSVAAAVYWKNGTLVQLTDGAREAFGEGIAVSGSDVYVVGHERDAGFVSVAMLWKNGEPTALASGASEAYAVAVSGSDVYVAGYEVKVSEVSPGQFVGTPVAKYWKNGVASSLTDGTYPAVARGIAVSGSDLHVVGWTGGARAQVARHWKNDAPVALTDGTFTATASAVSVRGAAIYVAGGEYDGYEDVAKLWRDGVPMDLSHVDVPRGEGCGAAAVAGRGDDVWAAGHDGPIAVVWENGAPEALTGGETEANALGIAITER
jgi:hypothetical protein